MKTKTDYSKEKNRIKALEKLNKGFVKDLRVANIELHKNAICRINRSSIGLSVKDTDQKSSYYGYAMFASDITLHSKNGSMFGSAGRNEISFGSCGSFEPKHTASYWRTVTAASILKNWKAACDIVNSYCKQYDELGDEIRKQIEAAK